MRKGKKRETIQEPHAHADYVRSMNGVDRNDRDSHDYSTRIHSNLWYIRIFLLGIGSGCSFSSIVTFLAEQGIRKQEWKK